MFRQTLDLTPATDENRVLDGLAERLRQSGVKEPDATTAIESTRAVVRTLCDQGRRLSGGSQMNVNRDLSGPGYQIRLRFRSSPKRGLLALLFGR
ncbi:MAG TPA: hypothetical protein VG407_03575 [Caulobacteraceae bacterium]|jgi:hypothetical protein|nr:hypothetical protein [Caulobacteraceae bacterium]